MKLALNVLPEIVLRADDFVLWLIPNSDALIHQKETSVLSYFSIARRFYFQEIFSPTHLKSSCKLLIFH